MAGQRHRLERRARTIFEQLGYTVSGDGREFRAERAWKVVSVTTDPDADLERPAPGQLRCFVTERGDVQCLRDRLRRRDPDYEYAIISVDGGDHEVVRAPPAGR